MQTMLLNHSFTPLKPTNSSHHTSLATTLPSLTNFPWKRTKDLHHTACNCTASNGGATSLLITEPNGKAMVQNFVLSPNGTTQEEMMEDFSKNQMGFDQGIGIVSFLERKSFLITGATGFVAKVLIEKILRTQPEVGRLFLLIRAESREAALERIKSEIINTELFRLVQEIHGESYNDFMSSKLVPIVGDVTKTNLGIEVDIAGAIADEVDVIVNSSANTTFDERYDVALNINTRGPCRLMRFAKRCKKLKLFLHVSTAYVNGQRQGRVMEKAFSKGDSIARERNLSGFPSNPLQGLDVEAELKLAMDLLDTFQDDKLVANKMKELGLERARMYGWQDTYVFTKAMAEMVIDSMKGALPVVIMRPSVIESTAHDPFPGWMEGNRMMDPIILYYGKGLLTGFLADPQGVLDVVPADMVVNATLAAMATHGREGKAGINVYQVASSLTNPLVFEELASLMHHHFSTSPHVDSKGRSIHVPIMKLFRSMEDFSSHVWSDALQRSGGRASTLEKLPQRLQNIFLKSVEQAKYLANIYQPYTFYGGRFDNTNTRRLMEEMSEEERRSFGFDVESINWKDYISNVHIPGLRRHVMKGRGTCSKD
ncbi:hypothetical protein AMTRI_Chr03g140830 [Amborella trichopoda]|uniref:Fatty acyl-CoA reductase n=1 Tax=Amborella trichopoda TaxID=13333 RepID=W1P942_AMBTC|nr:fatty acyl-CoA reductase 2 [Amborella trichopoda]ERN04448.1 hypothetical protein AMTR_s00133p00107670 [Amborella trichopoda]|eukprot:XP_020521944.1 fatty acyl-CoA reductase 2 [Amborella trichopoda]